MQTDAFIHPSSVVEPGATIGAGASVGPLCHVGAEASIGAGTRLVSHVTVIGATSIGENCVVFPQAVLGGPPQDLGYEGGAYTALTIGSHNRIGEFVSINVGTAKGGGVTRVGDHNFIMAYTHIGHDCQIADHVIIVNGAQFAGHVTVEHHANVSGLTGFTQFTRVGAYAYIAAGVS